MVVDDLLPCIVKPPRKAVEVDIIESPAPLSKSKVTSVGLDRDAGNP